MTSVFADSLQNTLVLSAGSEHPDDCTCAQALLSFRNSHMRALYRLRWTLISLLYTALSYVHET